MANEADWNAMARGDIPSLVLLAGAILFIPNLIVNLSSRKIPGLNVYAQMQNEKEQEMISPVSPTESTPDPQRDPVTPLELLDTERNTRPIGDDTLLFVQLLLHSHSVLSHFFSVPVSFHSIAFSCVVPVANCQQDLVELLDTAELNTRPKGDYGPFLKLAFPLYSGFVSSHC